MLLLKDIQLAEGILGSLTAVLAIYLKDKIKTDTNIVILVSVLWCSLFYIRKIMLNLYVHYKKKNKISDKNLDIDVKDDKFNNFLTIFGVCIVLIIYYLSKNTTIDFNPKFSRGSILLIVLIIGVIMGSVYKK